MESTNWTDGEGIQGQIRDDTVEKAEEFTGEKQYVYEAEAKMVEGAGGGIREKRSGREG